MDNIPERKRTGKIRFLVSYMSLVIAPYLAAGRRVHANRWLFYEHNKPTSHSVDRNNGAAGHGLLPGPQPLHSSTQPHNK